ncbi:MAG: helix-turn-helix domain-containing protein [Candidatus Binatia bacterium]
MTYSDRKIFREKLNPTVEEKEVLLNSRQAAELLDVSPDAVNELARKNTLPGVKRGRQWRFRRQDIASLRKQRQGLVAA